MNIFLKCISRDKITLWLLMAVPASVFLPIKYSSSIIILATANSLFRKDVFANLKLLYLNKLALVLIITYLVIVVSALFSDNRIESFATLERKLSYLVFPILLLISINESYIKKITFSFCIATFLAIIYSLIKALIHYNITKDINVFFYHELGSALSLNAIYFSIYCAFSFFSVLHYYPQIPSSKRYILLFFALVFFLAIVLLSSKNILFVVLIGLIYNLFKQRFLIRSKLYVWFLVSVPILLIWLIKPVKNRFLTELNSKTEVVFLDSFRYDTPFTGFTLRIVIWKNCFEILNEKKSWLFGVGVGDFQDLLNNKYKSEGMYIGNKQLGDTGYWGYNPHNQWIESLLSMGLIGLILLGFLVIFFFQQVNENKFLLGNLLLLIFFSVSLTECVLSTNKGMVFFLFFISLFSKVSVINTKQY